MVKCGKNCYPCCDFCIYAVHEILEDEDGAWYGEPFSCDLHKDAYHDMSCESCGYCDDFHCVNAKE